MEEDLPELPEGLEIIRYDLGGARLYFETDAGRDLIMDLYDDERGERREAIIRTILDSGVLSLYGPRRQAE